MMVLEDSVVPVVPDVHERAAGLVQPDTLLATQYFDRIRRRKDFTGEQRLMFAVLEDAVDVYRKHATTSRRRQHELFVEAERWIESDDRSWIYTFATICDYLGLDPDYLRRGLRAWKRHAAGEVAPVAVDEVAAQPEHRRASNE